jgi:phosphoglycerate dehydrogenase-like enzyme
VAFDWSGGEPPEGLADAEVLVAFRVPGAWATESAAPRLRWVHSPGAGADRVLSPELGARGLLVSSSRGTFDQPVAEHALALLLALSRRLPVLAARQAERRWSEFFGLPEAVELAGRTVTVLGLGSIGGRVAELLQAVGMRVIGVRRRAAPHPAATRVTAPSGLLDALRESDAVVIVLPDAPDARRAVGRRELEALRPGALVVNVGRGSSLDHEALVDLLRAGRLGGAGLDVADPEPPPPDSPLWTAPNLILSGHTGGFSEHHPVRQLDRFGDNLEAYLAGRPLPGRIDVHAGY